MEKTGHSLFFSCRANSPCGVLINKLDCRNKRIFSLFQGQVYFKGMGDLDMQ